jgi:hypothetical protein
MVEPDLEETRKRVFAGSMVSVTACTQAGTVESSTMSFGYSTAPSMGWWEGGERV